MADRASALSIGINAPQKSAILAYRKLVFARLAGARYFRDPAAVGAVSGVRAEAWEIPLRSRSSR